MKVHGYVRVSASDQNTARQEDLMRDLGVDKVYIEKVSGKSKDRAQLKKMLSCVKKGDTVIVESISRFARNTKDLLELVEILSKKGVEFISKKENIDTTTPTGKFMLTIFGAVSELERESILQRQAEGIAAAKARGVHMGRPVKEIPSGFGELVRQWEKKKIPLAEVRKQCGGICEATFYRRLAEYRLMNRK